MRSLYEFGRFTLDPDEHRLSLAGQQVAVTPKAFDILVVLVQRAPRLVTKEQLMKEVWPDAYVEEANLSVHISALRKTLAETGEQEKYIETVPRRGYRFVAPVREVEIAPPEPGEPAAQPPPGHDAAPSAAPLLHEDARAGSIRSAADEPPTPPPSPTGPSPAAVPEPNVAPADSQRRTHPERTPPAHSPAGTRPRRWALIAGTAALIAAAAALGWLALPSSSARRGDFSWERVVTEGRLQRLFPAETGATDPALSPDGRMLAFVVADAKGRSDLYVTRLSGGGQLRLTNDDALEQHPRFSPDGDRLLFTRLEPQSRTPQVRVISTLGGNSTLITQGSLGTWAPRGDRIAYINALQADGLPAVYTCGLDGTDVREVLASSAAYPFVRHPAWSRDGSEIAVVRGTGGIAGEIWLVPAAGGEPRRFTNAAAEVWSEWPSFTPDGSGIVYTSNRGGAANLWIQMFDSNRSLRLTTGPGPEAFPTIADNGMIAFLSSRNRDELVLHVPATGQTRTLLSHAPYIWAPVFSPEGREVTFSRSEVDGSWHLWTAAIDGEAAPRQLTSGTQGEIYPRYTADGRWVIFHSWGTPRRIWRVAREGGTPVQLTFGDFEDGYADPSPDGERFAFARTDGAERIHLAPLAGGEARPLTSRPSTVPRWSPDGKLIAFSPSRGFNGGILVIAPDGTGERRLTDIGGWPVWSPDGTQVSYIAVGPNGSQQIWTVPLAGGPPRLLDTLTFSGSNYPFDIARDGRRIIASRNVRISREIWLLQAPGS